MALSVPAAYAQSQSPTKSSVENSPNSATRAIESQVPSRKTQVLRSCASAVEELRASSILIGALENETAALKERLEIEKKTTKLLTELNETRKAETDSLRTALDAKNETIAAKDAVIASQDKLVETLKRKKSSPWKRVLDVLVGVGVATVLR